MKLPTIKILPKSQGLDCVKYGNEKIEILTNLSNIYLNL